MGEEARLERRESGCEPVTEGWFVVNVEDAAWWHRDGGGAACVFESEEVEFPQVGYTLAVLRPGESGGLYHREEEDQEGFLVLAGEALLLVEGEERRLKQWDFFHCPAGTEHIVVGAGDGPCVVFMVGSRRNREALVYPRSELALEHGVGVEQETTSPKEAYSDRPRWSLGRPDGVWPPPD